MRIFIINKDYIEDNLFIEAVLLNANKIICGHNNRGYYEIDDYPIDINNMDEILERITYGEKQKCDIWFPRKGSSCYELWKSTPDVNEIRLKIELD